MKSKLQLTEEALELAERFSPDQQCPHCDCPLDNMNVDKNGEWISIKDLNESLSALASAKDEDTITLPRETIETIIEVLAQATLPGMAWDLMSQEVVKQLTAALQQPTKGE